MIKCDFCCMELPEEAAHRFPCRSFQVRAILDGKEFVFDMHGDWAGCAACAPLVLDECWDELLERSCMTYQTSNEVILPIEIVRHMVGAIHNGYRENRQ